MCFSAPVFLFDSFYDFCLFLILSICWHIIFPISLSYLFIFSLSSLRILKRVDLKPLLNSISRISQELFLLVHIFPVNELYFHNSLCSLYFLLRCGCFKYYCVVILEIRFSSLLSGFAFVDFWWLQSSISLVNF